MFGFVSRKVELGVGGVDWLLKMESDAFEKTNV